jgi:hypothetical protein
MIDLTKYIAISPDISDTWEKANEINSKKYKELMRWLYEFDLGLADENANHPSEPPNRN